MKMNITTKMNTDVTALMTPEYPVIDPNPTFAQTVANFNTLDYLRFTIWTGGCIGLYSLGGLVFKPWIRGPWMRPMTGLLMVTGGWMGTTGGFTNAFQNSQARLMGYYPNEGEVAKYKK